ncbi:hypothetical protein BaRGS_00011092, partial [Batillaria attramentaria]
MAEGGDHANIFKNLEDNLKLVTDQIKDGESERENKANFNADMYWNHLGVVFKALSLEATKLSLAFSKPPFPTAEECSSMSADVEKTVLALVSAFYSLPKTQGITLRKHVKGAVLEVVHNLLGLVTGLAEFDPVGKDRRQATGQVWEGADNFSTLPRTAQLVQDALEEVKEMVNNDGQCEDLDDIFAEEDTPRDNTVSWSAQDKELVGPCTGLVKTVRSLLKKTREVTKSQGKCETDEQVAQLDDLSDFTERLSPAVDNLTSCLYPPVDHAAVGKM